MKRPGGEKEDPTACVGGVPSLWGKGGRRRGRVLTWGREPNSERVSVEPIHLLTFAIRERGREVIGKGKKKENESKRFRVKGFVGGGKGTVRGAVVVMTGRQLGNFRRGGVFRTGQIKGECANYPERPGQEVPLSTRGKRVELTESRAGKSAFAESKKKK